MNENVESIKCIYVGDFYEVIIWLYNMRIIVDKVVGSIDVSEIL